MKILVARCPSEVVGLVYDIYRQKEIRFTREKRENVLIEKAHHKVKRMDCMKEAMEKDELKAKTRRKKETLRDLMAKYPNGV